METTKMTKAMYLTELRKIVEENVADEMQTELIDFINRELASIEKRREAAARRAEKKRAESDALTDAIFAELGEEPMTLDEIMERFADNEEVTKNKVSARLGKLVKAGKVEKEPVKIEGVSHKRMSYRLAEVA